MVAIRDPLQAGAVQAWVLLPTALLPDALHGLELGHSQTLTAGFIVATWGSVAQAVLPGLSAAPSHTVVVRAIARGGLLMASHHDTGAAEPYFQLAAGVTVVGLGIWLQRSRVGARPGDHGSHDHDHHHGHDHDHGHDGNRHGQGHWNHAHAGLDAHAPAHAEELRQRPAVKPVATRQIILFGLTRGLIPCPAAIAVVLLCRQRGDIGLGVGLVLSFSTRLAVVMVAVRVVSAIGLWGPRNRWAGHAERFARHAPAASAALMVAIGLSMAWHGWRGFRCAHDRPADAQTDAVGRISIERWRTCSALFIERATPAAAREGLGPCPGAARCG